MQQTFTDTVAVNSVGSPVLLDVGDGNTFYTNRIQIPNTGASVVKIYLTEADFDADQSFLDLSATTGFYDGDMKVAGVFWARSVDVGGTDITFVVYRHVNPKVT